ncbi:MAG: HD domain-containing protein [Clostridiales bacterium]|nr:HD domain-containing protein [Clostridiales bacterium]
MLQQVFYSIVFALSLICALIYIYMWHKHFDVNFTMIFTLVPVACLGYLMSASADSLEGAIRAQQVIYIGGCFLQYFILLSILNLCKIEMKRWVRPALFAICAFLYASVLTVGHLDIFYKKVSFDVIGGVPTLTKEYGGMHTLFYVTIILFFLIGMITIVYSIIKKNKQVPRNILYLLVIPDVVCVFSFFIGRKLLSNFDIVPLAYVLAELVYLLIAYRFNLYDVSDTVIDSFVKEQNVGYISFDFNYRYLGSNEVARALLPEIEDIEIDESIGYKPEQRKIRHYLDSFKKNASNNKFVYNVRSKDGNPDEDRIYNVTVNYLYDANRKRGYIISFADDTANRKYIKLLDSYNETLKNEVDEKTKHIVDMHDNLIMSMAMMVESRDNSTGGHIKRTSTGVKILIEEIIKEGGMELTDEFCRDVIKAAPMHDLGKIAVKDQILTKEGRFTDEEYDEMKRHAAEGARVIHEILKQTDDISFKIVAENVAHYHHERWDGSGYPEGLAGEDIPLEARIMAIADVYDALVSKRVYKEAYDLAKADRIIMEGMGSQFDPGLEPVYVNARPRLEEYYSKLQEA